MITMTVMTYPTILILLTEGEETNCNTKTGNNNDNTITNGHNAKASKAAFKHDRKNKGSEVKHKGLQPSQQHLTLHWLIACPSGHPPTLTRRR